MPERRLTKKERSSSILRIIDPTIDPSQGYRTQANFHSASMLVLDFDKGSSFAGPLCRNFLDQGRQGRKAQFHHLQHLFPLARRAEPVSRHPLLQDAGAFAWRLSGRLRQRDCKDCGTGLPHRRNGHRPKLPKRRAILLHSLHEPRLSRSRLFRAVRHRDPRHCPLRHRSLKLRKDSASPTQA